jgi:4-amino-4-deoxy-L-arabinose transferase-like glycosyltransferase
MRRTWAVVVVAALLYVLTGRAADGLTGLTQSIVANGPSHDGLAVGRVKAIDLDSLDASAGAPAGMTAVWEGFWEVTGGAYDLMLDSNGGSTWTIDDTLTAQAFGGAVERTVWLAAGFHRIEIRYDVNQSQPRLVVAAARTGQPLKDLPTSALKPRLPRNPWLRAVTRAVHTTVGWVSLLALAWAIRRTIREWPDRWRRPLSVTAGGGIARRSVWLRRGLAWTVLAGILVHAALLRIDAITGRFGVVSSPHWLSALQVRSTLPPTAIRPAWIVWEPESLYPHGDGPPTHYRSDPYTYLDAARKMTTFYMPHFREQVFPFVTKLALGALDDQDVAVSFASTAFSLLAIWFTYLLGAAVWSRPVGLLASLGLSLDYNVISLASLGWRDDAYMAAFTMCACLLLRYWRVGQDGAPRAYRVGRWNVDAVYVEAVLLGLGAGLAILTRIMAISFLVAGLGWTIVGRRTAWRRQLAGAAIVALVAVVTSAPYFIACWRAFGDPFLTFNVHAPIYSAAEGQVGFQGSTASYVRGKIASRPREVLDTILQGVTSYPFLNKWHGLNRWRWGLDHWAMIAGLAGLVVFAGSTWGRLLLVVTVTSLVPFSLTWTVDPDYRFTVYVYPVLLVAAAVACGVALRVPHALLTSDLVGVGSKWRGFAWRPFVATIGAALVVLWFVTRVSPSLVFAEALKAGEDVSLTAGARDGASFRRGWSELVVAGNVRSRIATHEAELRVRLPDQRDYPATLRMDPFPRPLGDEAARLPRVDVILNGVPVATVDVRWTPGRVGSYAIVLPRAAVRRGTNRLVLRVVPPASRASDPASAPRPGLTDGDALAMWYLRVHPAR